MGKGFPGVTGDETGMPVSDGALSLPGLPDNPRALDLFSHFGRREERTRLSGSIGWSRRSGRHAIGRPPAPDGIRLWLRPQERSGYSADVETPAAPARFGFGERWILLWGNVQTLE